ncbi:hypothetical protein [Streptomyces sp. NPDC058441]
MSLQRCDDHANPPGIKFVLCKPRDPEAKGLVEQANGYLETSFH